MTEVSNKKLRLLPERVDTENCERNGNDNRPSTSCRPKNYLLD